MPLDLFIDFSFSTLYVSTGTDYEREMYGKPWKSENNEVSN